MGTLKVKSERVLLASGYVVPAVIDIQDGIIRAVHIHDLDDIRLDWSKDMDVGNLLVMAGVVDSHVHVNEPGRTDWEGYVTATKAAAAGGITTIVDMPLNSIPSTTSVSAFHTKLANAKNKCYVDVAFWGGVVPNNENELRPMIEEGIAGFKCFLIHSGVNEFPHVEEEDLRKALRELQGTQSVLLFHAEVDTPAVRDEAHQSLKSDPNEYVTFLHSRPKVMENEAIKLVCKMCLEYKVPCHIVHLSSAEALPCIVDARQKGAPLTIETCHHYLSFDAESVPNGATQYKCCPPIREKANQDKLWAALKEGHIDMVVSDHSPCTPDLKLPEEGDFMRAWGGVSSVQFGLSLFWTNAEKQGLKLRDLSILLAERTSKLAGLSSRKGSLDVGMDADLVIWDPDAEFTVTSDLIQHKNKLTPYTDMRLKGVIHQTILRGKVIFSRGTFSKQPEGQFLFRKKIESPGVPVRNFSSSTAQS